MIRKGDRVMYMLTGPDALKVNRRRTSGPSIAARMKVVATAVRTTGGATETGEVSAWPAGAQPHIGNTVREGMTFPGVVVEDWIPESKAAGIDAKPNLQVWLDGTDTLWVTSAVEGESVGEFTRLH
jgi:hypothetical protein